MIVQTTSRLWVVSTAESGKPETEVARIVASEGGNMIGIRFDKTLLKNAANSIDLMADSAQEIAQAMTQAAGLSKQQATTNP